MDRVRGLEVSGFAVEGFGFRGSGVEGFGSLGLEGFRGSSFGEFKVIKASASGFRDLCPQASPTS